MKGLSDSNLLLLCRKVTYLRFANRCFFCPSKTGLECHHIVKRKMILLRYDWRNQVLVCHSCHSYAETPEGKHKINELIAPFRDYLQARSGSSKQFFVDHGYTKADFLKLMYADLQGELMKYNLPF